MKTPTAKEIASEDNTVTFAVQVADEYAAIQSKAKTDIMNKIAKAISDEFTIDDDVTGGFLEEPYRSWVAELYGEFLKQ